MRSGEQGLLLRQQSGRTRTYPLEAVPGLRPIQVGKAVYRYTVESHDDELAEEEDNLVLRSDVGGAEYTTYNTLYSTKEMQPLIEALRQACPHAVVAETEFCREMVFADLERGMLPG